MGEKVSVIVPVYNVAPYLRKCLDSICAQTYSNLDIILADDGSTDESPKICDEYAVRDSRINVIHKPNGGVSSARNAALDAAVGEYVMYCDADDWMESDMVEYMYTNLKAAGVHLAICGYYNVRGLRRTKCTVRNDKILSQSEALEALKDMSDSGSIPTPPWAQIMERSVMENVRFPEMCIFEDTLTTYRVIEKVDRVLVLAGAKYNYVYRKGSITHKNTETANFGRCYAYETRYLDLVTRHPEFKDNMLHRYLYTYTKLARDGISAANREKFAARKAFFCSVADDIYDNPFTSWVERRELPILLSGNGSVSVRLWALELIRMSGRIPWKLKQCHNG